jgi:hypothetical protein
MIIVRLMGGLGNQMFQYAAGRRLAYVRHVPMKLDLSFFNSQAEISPNSSLRFYSLCQFNILEQFASTDDLELFQHAWKSTLVAKLFRGIQKGLPLHMRSVYRQKGEGFDQAVLELGGDVYLNGYWQDWRYFVDIQETIRGEFTLRKALCTENQSIAEEIKRSTAVGIHIRRGDYVSNPKTNQYHGICSLDYYHQAIKVLSQQIINPHFYIFSDEPEWVEANFQLKYPFTIMKDNGVEQDYEDMYLMSLCQHFIIANSSFSWWAAWLSPNQNKIVIGPKQWFNKKVKNRIDHFPDTWIKL